MIQSLSICPEYSGVSSSRYSFLGAPTATPTAQVPTSSNSTSTSSSAPCVANCGSSSPAGHTTAQLSAWMGSAHAYGQSVSESLVAGGPLPRRGFLRGAVAAPTSTSCGCGSSSSSCVGAGGQESHESASEPQRPLCWSLPSPSQYMRRT